ncbi:MAG TPA: polyphosphate kinase 2 family protein [Gemmataceae bacterium]|nr:polyphosphate kinase 2 family protein [Gemmataceae bacterium]
MFADRFRVKPKSFRLRNHDPADTAGLTHEAAQADLTNDLKELAQLHEQLFVSGRHALLVILQGLDACGKDGTVKHVMSGLNPTDCQVHSFKEPTATEVRHDFLWRCACRLPQRGNMAIFNRSYYEEVLVVRVHPEFLDAQRLPPGETGEALWQQRFEDIVHFERYLTHNGIHLLKFFLNISKEEQRQRLLKRIDNPAKHWKFSPSDYSERLRWEDYQQAYEDMLRHTSTPAAPWYVIPADHKWLAHLAVAKVLLGVLQGLDLSYPKLTKEQRAEMAHVKKLLEREG